MNHILDELRRLDSPVFDRLADGELPPHDERSLLAALDDEPGGWRRCALALLEARALAGDLAGLVSAPRMEHPAPSAPPAAPVSVDRALSARPGRRRFGVAALATAACCGLVLGAWGNSWRVAGRQPDDPSSLAHDALGQDPNADARLADDWAPELAGQGAQWSTLRLTIPGDSTDDDENLELPVVHAAEVDPTWFEEQPPVISADVLDAWRAAGHQVRRHAGLWPIELDDGRRLLLPFEEFEIERETL